MKRSIIAVLVTTTLIAGWFWLRGDPDVRAIQRAFDHLNEAAQWEQREDRLRAGLAARRILGVCERDVVFDVHDVPYRFTNRGELEAAIMRVRTLVDRLSIQVTDSDIAVGPDRLAAEMWVTARITIRYSTETSSDLRSVKLQWTKSDEGWMLARIESYETIDGS